jgi:hypothetical protein
VASAPLRGARDPDGPPTSQQPNATVYVEVDCPGNNFDRSSSLDTHELQLRHVRRQRVDVIRQSSSPFGVARHRLAVAL